MRHRDSSFATPDHLIVIGRRAVRGSLRVASDAENRLKHIRKAVLVTPAADPALLAETRQLEDRLNQLLIELRGDRTLSRRMVPAPPSISGRIRSVVSDQWYVSSAPTKTLEDSYEYAAEAFTRVLADLRTLVETDIEQLESKLDEAGAPWTPGRFPTWEKE